MFLFGCLDTTPINSPRKDTIQSSMSGGDLGLDLKIEPKVMDGDDLVLLLLFVLALLLVLVLRNDDDDDDDDNDEEAPVTRVFIAMNPFLGFPNLYLLPEAVLTVIPSFIFSLGTFFKVEVVTVSPSKMLGLGWLETRPVAPPSRVISQLSSVGTVAYSLEDDLDLE